MTSRTEQLRQESWTKALHCLATSYIFQKKSEKYEKYIRYNAILGLIIPLLIGSVAASYGADSRFLKWVLIITAPFTITQIIISGLSLANKWDTKLSYSLESQTENRVLYENFQKLGKFPPNDEKELEKQFEILSARDSERTKQDEKITFSDKENRMGMHYALMILNKACVKCGEVPTSMTSTKCQVCGNF